MDRRTWLSLTTLSATALWLRPAFAAEEPLAVIVHPSNPARVLDASTLAAIFMSRKLHWDHRGRIAPFNYAARHAVRVQFDRAVLGMDPDEVARYWIDQRVRGGNPPPRQVPNAALIPRLVEELENAIAYAPAADIAHKVRIVALVKGGKVEAP